MNKKIVVIVTVLVLAMCVLCICLSVTLVPRIYNRNLDNQARNYGIETAMSSCRSAYDFCSLISTQTERIQDGGTNFEWCFTAVINTRETSGSESKTGYIQMVLTRDIDDGHWAAFYNRSSPIIRTYISC